MKTARLISIIMTLLEKDSVSASMLAEMFEVSLRTIYRDIDALGRTGVPVTTSPGPGGGISIISSYKVSKRFFTDEDIVSMLMGLNSLKEIPSAWAIHTVAKVRGMLPVDRLTDTERKAEQIKIDLMPWHSGLSMPLVFDTLRGAVERKQVIRFAYGDRNQENSVRDVEPLRLLLKGREWYMQGYCRIRQAYRTFKLFRIKDISVLDEYFEPRVLVEGELDHFDFNEKLEEVTLRVHQSIWEKVALFFGEENVIADREGNFFIAKGMMPVIDGTCRFLLGLGDKCECLAPESMRERLKGALVKLSVIYGLK